MTGGKQSQLLASALGLGWSLTKKNECQLPSQKKLSHKNQHLHFSHCANKVIKVICCSMFLLALGHVWLSVFWETNQADRLTPGCNTGWFSTREEEGESNDDFLLETLSYLLGESFRRAVKHVKTLQHIQFPITEMIHAVIQLPPDESTLFSPELDKALDNTHDSIGQRILCVQSWMNLILISALF